MTAALVSACEIGVFFTAAWSLFRRWEHTTAEAAAYAAAAVLMGFSFVFQAAFLIGLPGLALWIEGPLFLWSLSVLRKNRETLKIAWRDWRACPSEPAVGLLILVAAFAYLLYEALTAFPDPARWPSLQRMALLRRDASLFPVPEGMASGLSPLNADVLPYLWVRWDASSGMGVFGFLAYAGIGCSTYALARRYAWPPGAMCVTVMVLSFPRFMLHAVSPGDEIVPVSAAVFSLLAVHRFVERFRLSDFLFLILGIFFQISDPSLTLVFPLISAVLAYALCYQRHGMFSLKALFSQNRVAAILSLIPAVLFSQIWLFAYNIVSGNPWAGFSGEAFHPDGILGAAANMFRYALQALRLPGPVETLLGYLRGGSWAEMLMHLHDIWIAPLFGARGAALPLTFPESLDAATEGFGPFGLLLVWPALLYAFFRGPRRLKAIARGLLVYSVVVSLILAWTSTTLSHFSGFYACGGFCTAFLLPPWRLTSTGRVTLQVACGLLMALTCFRM